MNSKDLRNISEAYQNIQEQPRPATRIPGATGGAVTGSLRSGNLSFPGDKSGAYDATKQKLNPSTTPKVELPKIKTPPQTGGLLGSRNVPTMKDLGAAPKPQFGADAVKSSTPAVKQPLRPGGQTPAPNFKVSTPTTPRTPVSSVPTTPKLSPSSVSTLSRGASLLKNLKGLAKGPIAVAAEIGAEKMLEPVAREGGNALARTLLDLTGKGNRARQVSPSLYGKAGPDFTQDIAKGIQQRSKLAQQSAETQAASQPKPEPTGERSAAANAKKQELAKAEAQRRREATKPAPKPPTAQERAYGERSKLTQDQQAMNRQYDIDRGLENGKVTKPQSKALDKYLAKRKK